ITPVYSLKEGLTQKDFQKYALKALQLLKSDLKTQVPYDYRQKYHFMPLSDALHSIHQPMNFDEIKEALRMLKYEEFLQFSLTMQYIKMTREQEGGIIKIFDSQPLKQMIAHLPFHLTDDQQQAVREILHDMARPSAMYRFLQGDVGSGKTVVAAIALYANVLAGYQGALMVPTEVLANQHYASLKKLFASTNLEIGLLTGSLSLKEKREVHAQIADGTYDIIVGTHALFQEKVTYANLGLVITDEQHRFGVEQRKALKNKGNNVDFLVMSATPIPRTLAMTLYGDMDVSTIHTMPFGRQKTITKYVKGRSMRPFLNHLKQYLAGNGQVYVICPLIEDHETSSYKSATQVYEAMSRYFGGHYTLGLLHGALKEEDKARIMTQFQSNQIQILVSTTVIEVGIDVANANMMVIYDAHTFGLSQIHQLRGRIGRGQQQGYCYLLSDSEQEEAVERLRFMENHHDGFEIAQYDLELRGPGEVLGQKQSGLPSFTVGHIIRDFQILEASKNDAQEIIEAYYKYDEHHDLIVSI
ncbi:MAG: ATP-dependent DNA helicase RecG, partial [bacterium]